MTPFEFFRTPIQIRRFTTSFYQDGIWVEGSYAVINSDLQPGNSIGITINGLVIPPIPYTISSENTMLLLAQAIKSYMPFTSEVLVRANGRMLELLPTMPNMMIIDGFSITGGSSQPSVNYVNQPTIINATASVQPLGKDIELVPEGRRDSAEFKFYTSTEIFGVTTQNPDQVTVIKPPFTGIVYEVINISDWQNNPNFTIVNHYKFVALRIHPLPGILG